MDTKSLEKDNKISKIIPDDLSDLSFEELQLLHSSVGNAHIPNQTIPPDEATSITNQSYAGIQRTPFTPAAAFAELDVSLFKSGLMTNSGCTENISNRETTLEGPDLNLPSYQTKDIKILEINYLQHIGSPMHSETHPKPEISSGNLEGQDVNLPNYQSKDIKTLEMISALNHSGYTMYSETQPTPGTLNSVFSTPVKPPVSNPTASFGTFASFVENGNMDPKYFTTPDKQLTVCQRTTDSTMQELQNSNADGCTHFYEEDARSLHGQVSVEAELNSQSRVDASIENSALPSHIRSDINLPSTSFGTSDEQMDCNDETNTFRCELCGKTFTKSNLVSHYIDKHGLKICSECRARFYNDSYLQKHMRFHSEERRFQCLKCKKRFKSKACLKSHYLVHLRNILFKCEKCPQTFTDKGFLQIHEQYFHL